MNKSLFYGIVSILIAANVIFLVWSGADTQPNEFIWVLVATTLITTIMFTVQNDSSFGGFVFAIYAVLAFVILAGLISQVVTASTKDLFGNDTLIPGLVSGARWTALIWPVITVATGDGFKRKWPDFLGTKPKEPEAKQQNL